jgi:hypothetical protein
MDAGQAAREMEKIIRALEHMRLLLAGHDQASAATDLATEPRYSPLRTLVEQAEVSGQEILHYLQTVQT